MRKLMIFMVTCLLILSLPLTVYGSAEDGEMAFEELYNDWEMNGYPDYVGHVIYDSDEDQYVIGLVDPSEAEIDELESKLGDSPNLVLGEASYSYNELLSLQEKIWQEIGDIEGIYGMGIGWTNIDGEVTGFGESGHEMRLVVSVDESVYDEISERLASEYGDMVYTELGAPPTLDTLETEDASSNESIYLTIITVLFLAMLGMYFIRRKTFIAVKESADGSQVIESKSLSRNDVISALKESGFKPRDDLYEDIEKKIKEEE